MSWNQLEMIAALNYDQPFPFATILVPSVRLANGRLYFKPGGSLRPAPGRPERLVFDFANLATAPEVAFVEFAQTWGVLGVCRHNAPIHHLVPACLPARYGDEFVESITFWRRRAIYVRSLLNLKTALDRGTAGEPADWKVV